MIIMRHCPSARTDQPLGLLEGQKSKIALAETRNGRVKRSVRLLNPKTNPLSKIRSSVPVP
jgi:hypothetical protein